MMKTPYVRRIVVVFLIVVTAITYLLPITFAYADTGKLDTPIVIEQRQPTRTIIWSPVPNAVSYTMYAFDSRAAASDGLTPVAVAEKIDYRPAVDGEGKETGNYAIDIRTIDFTGNAITDVGSLPPDYVRQLATTGNLKPGTYWIRIQAIATNTESDSELSQVATLPIIIAVGPSELREMIEDYINGIGDPLFLLDLRPESELYMEGYVRFFDKRIINVHLETSVPDSRIAELLPDKDATILLICRAGGRTRQGAERLALLGYTNVLDAQGVNQWIFGRCYDHPDFEVRNFVYEPRDDKIMWLDIAGVEKTNIFVFENAEETDISKAVATGSVQGRGTPEQTIMFKLDEFDPPLDPDSIYYFRLQGIAETYPVRGYTPATNWGANSPLSAAISNEVVELTFSDVSPDDWFFEAVAHVARNRWFQGCYGKFSPYEDMTRAMVAQVLANWSVGLIGNDLGAYANVTPSYDDVKPADWHFRAIQWALEFGVFKDLGLEGGNFEPNKPVSRQELAVMIYNYLKRLEKPLVPTMEVSYPDQESIADWAREAVYALSAVGFIGPNHADGRFDPNAIPNRAEAALVFQTTCRLL